MSQTSAFGAPAADQPLAPLAIERREPGARDVAIDILFCGVCHSDLHTVRNEWGRARVPDRARPRDRRPGHRGRREVTSFEVGDLAGVGCMVDSCRTCASCGEGLEQYCESGFTGTYNGLETETRPA